MGRHQERPHAAAADRGSSPWHRSEHQLDRPSGPSKAHRRRRWEGHRGIDLRAALRLRASERKRSEPNRRATTPRATCHPTLMKRSITSFLTLLITASATCDLAAEDLPETLMTTRGKLLASEDFKQTPPPFTGTPKGFASGYIGWHFNAGPATGKSGRWELKEGVFTG